MKVIETLAIHKGFAVCKGAMSSNDVYEYTAANTSADGVFSQLLFGIAGSGKVYDENDNFVMDIVDPGTIYDFKDLYGKGYKIVAGQYGGTWICINPMPADKVYNYELINSNESKIIIGTDKEQVVYCITGSITVNNREVKQMQYVRILKDTEANISVSKDSIALYFYT